MKYSLSILGSNFPAKEDESIDFGKFKQLLIYLIENRPKGDDRFDN